MRDVSFVMEDFIWVRLNGLNVFVSAFATAVVVDEEDPLEEELFDFTLFFFFLLGVVFVVSFPFVFIAAAVVAVVVAVDVVVDDAAAVVKAFGSCVSPSQGNLRFLLLPSPAIVKVLALVDVNTICSRCKYICESLFCSR